MALLLHIDTALENATVCFSENNHVIGIATNNEQKKHASFLHTAIKNLCDKYNIDLQKIDAVSVVAGPGSYTGLRVAMASAKGICYALQKPLITINTLELMAFAGRESLLQKNQPTNNYLFCPCIDARRMEVFTALFDASLNTIIEPTAVLIDVNFLQEQLSKYPILFLGNGSNKVQKTLQNKQAEFSNTHYTEKNIAEFAYNLFIMQTFADLAYSQPFYVKDFFTIQKK
jgi:tRNA threonylcarbamoyladenosine biosynthesis protein TsaB